MKALVFDADSKKLEVKQVEDPKISSPNSVLIAPKFVGVCGTDVHIIHGEFPCKAGGIILGHEIAGEVLEVGENVKHVKPGDPVGVDPNFSRCGNICPGCSKGCPHLCESQACISIGVGSNGGFAQKVEIHDSQVYLFPKELKMENAFLVETMSCVLHGRGKLGMLDPGLKILIIGGGVVGLLWGSLLHHEGQRNMTISEPKATRRQTAQKLKVFREILTPEELTQKFGQKPTFDLVIDCCGVGPAVEQGIHLVKKGGTMMIFACAAPSQNVKLNLFMVYEKELRILGALVNPLTYGRSVDLVTAMQDRYLNVDQLDIKEFTLDDYQTVLDALGNGSITKGVIRIE